MLARKVETDRDRPKRYVTRIELRSEGQVLGEFLFEAGRVIVGRAPDNEIYIKSKYVSRHHAQLISDEHGCVVEDLNSTNGVFVDEERVKKHRLKDGDVVSMGVHELVYSDLRETATETGSDRLLTAEPTEAPVINEN